MCFYENYRFPCGDWKWGNFRQHCQKEYRTGETCGTKMVYNTLPMLEICPMCQKIDRKKRRYEKLNADLRRWYHDPSRKASASKAQEDMQAILGEINSLVYERDVKRNQIGNNRARK